MSKGCNAEDLFRGTMRRETESVKGNGQRRLVPVFSAEGNRVAKRGAVTPLQTTVVKGRPGESGRVAASYLPPRPQDESQGALKVRTLNVNGIREAD